MSTTFENTTTKSVDVDGTTFVFSPFANVTAELGALTTH
jgi:hypothetical protein